MLLYSVYKGIVLLLWFMNVMLFGLIRTVTILFSLLLRLRKKKLSCLFPVLLEHCTSDVPTMSFSLDYTFSFCNFFFSWDHNLCVLKPLTSVYIGGLNYPPLFRKMAWQKELVVHALFSELRNIAFTLVLVLEKDIYTVSFFFFNVFFIFKRQCEALCLLFSKLLKLGKQPQQTCNAELKMTKKPHKTTQTKHKALLYPHNSKANQ